MSRRRGYWRTLLVRARALGVPTKALRGINQFTTRTPIDLRIAGRTLAHAALVGAAAGLVGTAFFVLLEGGQRLLLEGLTGFSPFRALGERVIPGEVSPEVRWWLLPLVPALGALVSGLLTTWLAPEAGGGGGDAAIEAYHAGGGVRARVVPVKGIAAVFALASGGSGGREGPIMQMGAGIGSAVGRLLPATAAERRVLLVAGIAAGIAAVFRTPLGAALLATEMLFRDDFEADALVPAIFASVVAYSVSIALLGDTALFGTLPRFPFASRQLPLFGLLAIAVSTAGALFVLALRAVRRASEGIHVAAWFRPALGGLLMGCVGTATAYWMARQHGPAAAGVGVFGGGYGALQFAISGADWIPAREMALLLLALAFLKLVASALTIGSGAAAGDFAPSLVIGGLIGSAFGYGARQLLHDPSIDPAAFALVGMGTFYGGLAHAPLAALVLVSELAGSYDLLVPMMLAIGISYVALRKHSLYPAQLGSRTYLADVRPTGREESSTQSITGLVIAPEVGCVDESASLDELAAAVRLVRLQRVAVVENSRGPVGLVEFSVLLDVPTSERAWIKVADAMVPSASVPSRSGIHEVADRLVETGLSQLPVVDRGEIVGWIGHRELQESARARAV